MSTRPRTPAPGTPAPGKLAITELLELKARRQPIVMVTAYDATFARLADESGIDVVLVGDSLGMVMHGFESTVPVTLDMMILQGHAVMRGSKKALVVVDLPFGTYEASPEQAFHTAARVLKETGCGAVKMEGGVKMAEHVRFTVDTGVQVYCCDPRSPWQRGTNENTNGLLRQYFPKGRDVSGVTQAELDAVALKLNTRPRETLGWATPAAALSRLLRGVALTG